MIGRHSKIKVSPKIRRLSGDLDLETITISDELSFKIGNDVDNFKKFIDF